MNEPGHAAFRYRAFLSYSHHDRRRARWLHRALENYRIPQGLTEPRSGETRPERLAPVFRDRDELPSSANLSDAVHRALEESEALIVLCSPAAARSRWVNQEIETFRKLGRSTRIFCFVIAGEPNSGDDRECLPPALRQRGGPAEAAAGAFEPLAADARRQGDGKRRAKLKLIAGLLGVGFDELNRRQLQREHRRMATMAFSSLAVSALTVSLAVMAYLSSQEADRRRGEAESLVEFLLGDLRQTLHEVGRLDLYLKVGDQAMEYFAAQPDHSINEFLLAQRARALRQIGESQLNAGESELALASFRDSLALARQAADQRPHDLERKIALANSHFYVGWVHLQRNDLDAARERFSTAIPIVDAVVAAEPGRAKWLVEQGYAYTNLGRVLELQGQLEEALKLYREVQQINDRLVQLEPSNQDYLLEVGFAHNNIAKVLQSLGELERAEAHYLRDFEIKSALAQREPLNNQYSRYLAASHFFLAQILTWQAEFDTADGHYAAAAAILDALLETDSGRIDWLSRKAEVQRGWAMLARSGSDAGRARDRVRVSLDLYGTLLENDPANAEWQSGLALSHIEAGLLELDQERVQEALASANSAVAALLMLREQEPANLHSALGLAQAWLLRGQAYQAAGNSELAVKDWKDAIELLDTTHRHSTSPAARATRRDLSAALGQQEEADLLASQLRSIGYQL